MKINCKKVFLSGKMRGIEKYNFPKFDELEKRLTSMGIQCVNPANISRQFKEEHVLNDMSVYEEMIRRQMVELVGCDAILLVGDNWNDSAGTRDELKVAIARDMKIYIESDLDD